MMMSNLTNDLLVVGNKLARIMARIEERFYIITFIMIIYRTEFILDS